MRPVLLLVKFQLGNYTDVLFNNANIMLEIRPNCEYCDKDLLPNAIDACICTYECTFCRDCVDNILHNVCPNCGGGFTTRPIRPKTAHRDGLSLQHQTASTKRVNTQYTLDDISKFSNSLKRKPPETR